MVLVGRRGARLAALVLVATAGLVSCGSEEGGSTATQGSSSTPASPTSSDDATAAEIPPGTPPCSDVWQDGAKLARSYDGCEDGGELVERESLACSSGQRLVRHADHFWAVLGGTIHQTERPLDRDREYVSTVRGCRA